MKKWIIGMLLCIALLACSVYIFIPATISVKTSIDIKTTSQGLHRTLLDNNSIARWWPGKVNGGHFYQDDFTYNINRGNVTVMPVIVSGQNMSVITALYLITITPDSTRLQWMGSIPASTNPFERVAAYFRANKINNNMNEILLKMQAFYSKPENIYGCDIKRVLISDSLLISTSAECKGYPTNQFIYGLIDKLRKYANNKMAKESGYPMLNISTTDSTGYYVKVALPTDKLLPSSGDIVQRMMPGRYKIVMAEVKGDSSVINIAFDQLQKYLDDYQLKSAAIPFYSLVTDRLKEPDANKWVTRIYFPAMIY